MAPGPPERAKGARDGYFQDDGAVSVSTNPLSDPTGQIVGTLDAAIAAATDAALIQKLTDAKTAIGLLNTQMQSAADASTQLQRTLDSANIALANGGVTNIYANKVIADAMQRLRAAKTKVEEANAQTEAMRQAMPPPDQSFVTMGSAAGFSTAALIVGAIGGYFTRGFFDQRAAKKTAALGTAGEEPAALPEEAAQETAPAPAAAATTTPRRKTKRVRAAEAAAEE